MSDPAFKPLSVADFKLSPGELKEIVSGAQKFLPPVSDDGEFIPVETKEPNGSSS